MKKKVNEIFKPLERKEKKEEERGKGKESMSPPSLPVKRGPGRPPSSLRKRASSDLFDMPGGDDEFEPPSKVKGRATPQPASSRVAIDLTEV